MNQQEVTAIGITLETVFADTQRRVNQLGSSFEMAKSMLRELDMPSDDAGVALPEPTEEEKSLRRKLKAVIDSGIGDVIGDLGNALHDLEPEILNGTLSRGEYPECVAIQAVNGDYMCSGVLIHKRWVLTSAHCENAVRVFIGDNVYGAILHYSLFEVIDRGAVGRARLLEVIGEIPNPVVATLAYECEFKGAKAVIVGFGIGTPGGATGMKRKGEVTITDAQPLTTQGTASAAEGDSGGPLIVQKDGRNIVYGLIEEALKVDDKTGTAYVKLDIGLVKAIEKRAGVALQKCSNGSHDHPAQPPANDAPGARRNRHDKK